MFNKLTYIFLFCLAFVLPKNVLAGIADPLVNALADVDSGMDEVKSLQEEYSAYADEINQAKNGIMGVVEQGRKYMEAAMEYQQMASEALADGIQMANDVQSGIQDGISQAQGAISTVQDGVSAAQGMAGMAQGAVSGAVGQAQGLAGKVSDGVNSAQSMAQGAADVASGAVSFAQEDAGLNKNTGNNIASQPKSAVNKMVETSEAGNLAALPSIGQISAAVSLPQNVASPAVSFAIQNTGAVQRAPSRRSFGQPQAAVPQALAVNNAAALAAPQMKEATRAQLPESTDMGAVSEAEFADSALPEEEIEPSTETPAEDVQALPLEMTGDQEDLLQAQIKLSQACLSDGKSEECQAAQASLTELSQKLEDGISNEQLQQMKEKQTIALEKKLHSPVETIEIKKDMEASDSAATRAARKIQKELDGLKQEKLIQKSKEEKMLAAPLAKGKRSAFSKAVLQIEKPAEKMEKINE